MPGSIAQLRRGRILWAAVRDARGNVKERPVLVLTATVHIHPGEPFEVMAITTSFPDPAPANMIELPWHPQGRSRTRLRRRSAAVLDWLVELEPSDVVEYQGDVPPQLMIKILNRLASDNRESTE